MVKSVVLTQGKFAIVDDEDYEWISKYKWSLANGYPAKRNVGDNDEKIIYLHREIMKPEKGFVVDHINRNKLDNRRENLRICTYEQNNVNSGPKRKGKKFKGVSYADKLGAWRATISKGGKTYHLGIYKTEEEAALVYNKKAKEFFGKYAFLNNVDEDISVKRLNRVVSSSGFKGVHYDKTVNLHKASVTVDKRKIYIGSAKTSEEAALKYDEYILKNKIDRPLNFGDKNDFFG